MSINQLLSSAGEKCFACQKCFLSAERVFKLRRSLAEEERKLQVAMLTLASFEYECNFTLDTLPIN